MKLLPVFLLLSLICSSVGCIDSGIVIVQERCESSFSLDKGTVYDADVWVRNEASDSKSAEVKVELIASNTGKIRDESTQIVNLRPNESKELRFTLDGEDGIDYQCRYEVKSL